MGFDLQAPFAPQGDQPEAIKKIIRGFDEGKKRQVLLGVTGSGKTFTMAHVIDRIKKPTIILSHNKTLAAQLYNEMKLLFPDNAVEYFVSYFDYYQPESYMVARDLYIEKDTKVNQKLEQMRLAAMHSLCTREDVIIIASVSCIYGIGDPEQFNTLIIPMAVGESISRKSFMEKLVSLQYERNDTELQSGRFRVRGECIDVIPGYAETIIRVTFFDDEIESITELDVQNLHKIQDYKHYNFYAAKQFVFSEERTKHALGTIKAELDDVLPTHEMLESHRLKQRTEYDLQMIEELGYCTGIENYSRHFDGRKEGQAPFTLLDYFRDRDYLMIIDESHVSVPQIHGMHKGDRSRKQNLIEYGFRLPSAFDNRPLTFEEFDTKLDKVLYVSATPADYEMQVGEQVVEQIIRPTGLVDPEVDVRPIMGQMDNLLVEIKKEVKKGFRVLVTTLTKRMAEQLSEFLATKQIKTRYLHSEIDTLDRTEIIRQLRMGEFDVLVGINLLREGIDIPEVSLVAILDADKQGFLRNTRSLIQIIGRAARNAEGRVIMYADKMTDSMSAAIEETKRRREKQIVFNKQHGIVPKTIIKKIADQKKEVKDLKHIPKPELMNMLESLEEEMNLAAEQLDFEKAILLRDKMKKMQEHIDAKEGTILYD